jgi:GNAT superfamily N-acetyltransferase
VTPDDIQVRARVPADVPVLAEALFAQQAQTRYPFRDPLPLPVEDFLHAYDAVKAWTAVLDGRPVGHVCRVGPAKDFPAAGRLNEVCARAHGCEPTELAWVSTLFVAAEARGLGIGRRLMNKVVDDVRAHRLRPCLEVLPTHPAALTLYRATGWRVVDRLRPAWLYDVVGHEGPDVHVMILTEPDDERRAAVAT